MDASSQQGRCPEDNAGEGPASQGKGAETDFGQQSHEDVRCQMAGDEGGQYHQRANLAAIFQPVPAEPLNGHDFGRQAARRVTMADQDQSLIFTFQPLFEPIDNERFGRGVEAFGWFIEHQDGHLTQIGARQG